MALATVERIGGKLVLALSDDSGQELSLIEGTRFDLQREESGLKIRPSRYTLDEMLAQCDYSQPMSDEECEWLDAPRVGRELI